MSSVVTANVNGVRAAQRRGGLQWLSDSAADVICLQEVRCDAALLPDVLASAGLAGYEVAAASAATPGRAGVAVLSKHPLTAIRVGLPGFADQGRWVEADLLLDGELCTVISAYVHTGEAGTDRQVEKFAFMAAMTERMTVLATRAAAGAGEALVTGDLNVAHRQADLRNWKGNLGKAGFLPSEQAILDQWFATGWTDLGRLHAGDCPGPYTWWSWRGKAFDNDAGWRIDYLLATPGLARRSVKVEVGRAASYQQRWTDHASVTAWFDAESGW